MKKILIIKLGALGDVIRTTPILEALRKKYPESEITWITKSNAIEYLKELPQIDKTLAIPIKLENSYDVLYNFDIEDEATELASKTKAVEKYGFYSEGGFPAAFNAGAEYYLNTFFDDTVKKENERTYQEMMFDAADLKFKGEKCVIALKDPDLNYARDFLQKNNLSGKKIMGIHIGSSPRWPSKAWSKDKVKDFIKGAKSKGYEIILFGGPSEAESHPKLLAELKEEGLQIYRNDPQNTGKQFASLINICSKVVCSDSLALHVSLALSKPTIALFFCTTPNEVETYDLLKKVISPKLYDYFPQKQDQYSEELVNSISVEEVLNSI